MLLTYVYEAMDEYYKNPEQEFIAKIRKVIGISRIESLQSFPMKTIQKLKINGA